MKHLMIDLETLGSGSFAVIASIAAVEFDIEKEETDRVFYRKIDIQSCLDLGLETDGATIQWWMQQEERARKEIFDDKNRYPIEDALFDFSEFVQNVNDGDLQVWGNGSKFDLGKLEDAYWLLEEPVPWNFRGERDVRTLVALNPKIKEETKFDGIKHYPLDDCKHQIKYVCKTWNSLKIKKK